MISERVCRCYVVVGTNLLTCVCPLQWRADDIKSERSKSVLPLWETVDLQDYRLRHASYVHSDEALRNIRRAVPLIASWDDHELANNAWVNGGLNHQQWCWANRNSPLEWIESQQCDRNEGHAAQRWKDAYKAYMEWLPLRHQEGTLGHVNEGTMTQVIHWGDLATIFTFDTRVSYRSRGPTEDFVSLVVPYTLFALLHHNVEHYSDPNSHSYKWIQKLRRHSDKVQDDPRYTLIGEDISIVDRALSESMNKTWQIWSLNIMFANQIFPSPELTMQAIKDSTDREKFRQFLLKAYDVRNSRRRP